jgi:hypothetical protein
MTNFHFFKIIMSHPCLINTGDKNYMVLFSPVLWTRQPVEVSIVFFVDTFGKNTLSSKQQPAIFTTETLAWQNPQSPFFLSCSCKDGRTGLFFECCTA